MDECLVRVTLEKQNKAGNKLVLQKGTKVKEVSWWVVIGDHENNVLGMKRVILKKNSKADILVGLPSNF